MFQRMVSEVNVMADLEAPENGDTTGTKRHLVTASEVTNATESCRVGDAVESICSTAVAKPLGRRTAASDLDLSASAASAAQSDNFWRVPACESSIRLRKSAPPPGSREHRSDDGDEDYDNGNDICVEDCRPVSRGATGNGSATAEECTWLFDVYNRLRYDVYSDDDEQVSVWAKNAASVMKT
jgi:hypothetical protein